MSENDLFNKHESKGYNVIMDEIRMHDWDDPYGTASDWFFALAGVYFMETGEALPGYTPSILYIPGWKGDHVPHGYGVDRLCEFLDGLLATTEDIKRVFTMISRYLAGCVAAGKDY